MKKQVKVLAIGVLAIIVLFFIPLDYYIIAPGEVFNLKTFVLTSATQEKNHFYAPSVAVYENKYFALVNTTLFNKLNTNPFYVIYALVSPSVEAKKLSDFLPKGTTSEQFEAMMQSATNISVTNIKYVVAKRLERAVDELNLTINVSAEGPSVAVAFALEAINQLGDKDLTNGLKIGAVGNLDRDGKVYTVGAIKQKILAAEKQQLDILFIPARDYTEDIKNMQTNVKIIPIATIDESLAFLQKKEKKE
ncbi:hypothetical protein HYS50_01630 [Candidatus Woesearchaeota archaeon]|nr:hypothetical protein [Candidatus Woesearchaeota archaeon]